MARQCGELLQSHGATSRSTLQGPPPAPCSAGASIWRRAAPRPTSTPATSTGGTTAACLPLCYVVFAWGGSSTQPMLTSRPVIRWRAEGMTALAATGPRAPRPSASLSSMTPTSSILSMWSCTRGRTGELRRTWRLHQARDSSTPSCPSTGPTATGICGRRRSTCTMWSARPRASCCSNSCCLRCRTRTWQLSSPLAAWRTPGSGTGTPASS
mmetsp:Transcript_61298/g.174130  ORF Transcript_61298/g.174130 Transcript_61298/m.174130 type:complete len:212 (+) Transcript_61298:249-884(+)